MKKIIAMLVAIVMCASVLAVVGSASWSDGSLGEYLAAHPSISHKISWFSGKACFRVWSDKGDGTDFTTVDGTKDGVGMWPNNDGEVGKNLHEWSTFMVTFYGDDYGTGGIQMNGLALNDCTGTPAKISADQVKASISVYKNVGEGWNNWEKLTVNDVEYVQDTGSGCGYWFLWFSEEVTTKALLVHYSTNYEGHDNSHFSSFAFGYLFVQGLYDSNGVHTASSSEASDPTPTGGDDEQPTAQRTLFTSGKHNAYACNITLGDDGKFTTVNDNWHWTDNSGGAQWFWDGQNHYNPFVGYDSAVTANEIVIGDVSHWDGRQIGSNLFTDYSKFQLFVTDDPNGAWTKVDFKGETYNCDQELNGTYQQGIRLILKKAVTAKYFLIYYPDSAQNELWTSAATMTAAYNPAYASADTGDMLSISIAVASVAILGTAAAIVMKKRKED
ncbi:MAG: hypothetical protein IKX86_02170 [Clostridia bacterium]|nr:hypothetical protein [Clostridia bacterium]